MLNITRPLKLFLLILLLLVAISPLIASGFYIGLMTKMMIVAIFAMSLDLLVGFTGLISLGHAAFFGIGAYCLAGFFSQADHYTIWIALPVSMGGAALAALVIGWISIRTTGVYFLMITLAFSQMFYFFFFESKHFNGDDGVFMNTKPEIFLGSFQLLDLNHEISFFYFVLGLLVAVFLLLVMILKAPFGQVITSICANDQRVRALGYAIQRYKLVSFVIGGAIAGLAGFLEAAHTGFITPSFLSWHESGLILVIIILGGIGTLYGPIFGAFALVLLEDLLPELTDNWKLMLGVIIIMVVLFLPNGISSMGKKLIDRLKPKPITEPGSSKKTTVS
ncbi:MAG: branched-chain amino acid ABC transporter permease [Deltaproteobacteria bacterium]|jgi:branched-chain amino acid transport system permease protein|nr:branched-chain amino acid ABC transporter permease [Deltaproteobacteria bacterium]MBT4264167.1 branched-chain amino acid ABC transporter permease [Deltaproteobacteria bacterium]MBT4637364.1 branched-chain amino acid ABC transporter permease [Deltaproteobacteria bacterium]MBT6499768.1 branched-chain amino acid ABC transporter permease [Deltaproteobacteria bacterium]MBT6614338.1 branched-chain amino acid ABC transporter permease [Deltaproteobacteria bacterium]